MVNMAKHLNAHQHFKLIHLYYIWFKMLAIHQLASIKYMVGIDITWSTIEDTNIASRENINYMKKNIH